VGCGVLIHKGSWPVPPLFQLIQRAGQIDPQEMAHVFNLGLGMLVVTPAQQAAAALHLLGEGWLVGDVVTGHQECILTEG
jgi:phosphoribosylformylglycinamidine cyclo-ligase